MCCVLYSRFLRTFQGMRTLFRSESLVFETPLLMYPPPDMGARLIHEVDNLAIDLTQEYSNGQNTRGEPPPF